MKVNLKLATIFAGAAIAVTSLYVYGSNKIITEVRNKSCSVNFNRLIGSGKSYNFKAKKLILVYPFQNGAYVAEKDFIELNAVEKEEFQKAKQLLDKGRCLEYIK